MCSCACVRCVCVCVCSCVCYSSRQRRVPWSPEGPAGPTHCVCVLRPAGVFCCYGTLSVAAVLPHGPDTILSPYYLSTIQNTRGTAKTAPSGYARSSAAAEPRSEGHALAASVGGRARSMFSGLEEIKTAIEGLKTAFASAAGSREAAVTTNALPDKGVVVSSRISHSVSSQVRIEFGDLGTVEGASSDGDDQRVLITFTNARLNLLASQFTVCHRTAIGNLVRSAIDYRSVHVGDLGVIVGPSGDPAHRDRLSIDFGFGDVVNLLTNQFRLYPHTVGSVIFSLIDHYTIKKGDRGVIVGISSDRGARDRVAVKFGLDPRAWNLDESMFTASQPTLPRASASAHAAYTSARHAASKDDSLSSLPTEDITLISHTHGRERRAERHVVRRELQAAIKHGKKELANPGRDGSRRWRYTYESVVYITDETSRHEITCWRVDGKDAVEALAPAEVELAGKGCHAVLIVDSSGSMRTPDVSGYKSRTEAVYDCLVKDFVREQVKSGAAKDVVVSLISMGDDAALLIDKQPLDESLIPELQKLGHRRAAGHGNYIPALDRALDVMTEDAPNRASVLLLFFSDGAPSDQRLMQCEHGMTIFEVDRKADPLMQHRTKASAWACRTGLQTKVKNECLNRVKRIGQVFGRDKVILRTLAFGPSNEDFRLLDEMAKALPRGEFQKLGLNPDNLRTAFSSLSSSMTELRTEGGGKLLTPRRDKVVDKNQNVELSGTVVLGHDGWTLYSFDDLVGKYEFDNSLSELRKRPLTAGATGLAFILQPFAEGAERFVYRCTEIKIPSDRRLDWYHRASRESARAERCGLRMVAKEAKAIENLGRSFHERFARVQHDAAVLAMQFNRQMPARDAASRRQWNVSFLPTSIYCCRDESYMPDGEAWVLVEPELEGKFTKWNNNAGLVRGPTADEMAASTSGERLGVGSMAVLEEDEEDDEDYAPIQVSDVPQAFSHFSYEHSRGKMLVCDIQGVWNAEDGFVLTDPVVHYVSSSGRRHKNGATDKGLDGVKSFFSTHKCNGLCAKLRLPSRSASDLIDVSRK